MTELKRAVCSWRMVLAVFLVLLILMNPFYMDVTFRNNMWSYMAGYDILDLITDPMALSGFTPFACIFPMIPCGTRFAEEYNSNYIRFTLPRAGRIRYISSKILTSLIAGGCVTASAFAILFIFLSIGGEPVTEETEISEFYLWTIWLPYARIWGGKLVLILKVILAFLHGAVWSLMALLVSAVYTNRYAALVIPFVIYQVSWNILSGSIFNPVYLLRGDMGVYSALYVPYLIQMLVILLLVVLNGVFLWRKCDGN